MANATQHSYNRIAIVFDFDDTLAPNSYSSLIESCGLDTDEFLHKRVQPLVEAGWDEILAKFYCVIEASRQHDNKITADYLEQLGANTPFFDGVPEMFERLRGCATELIPDIEVEFYLLSSGILEIARGTPIADQFKRLWGCEFHFAEDGGVAFIKRIVSHPEKVRYLLQLSKGIDNEGSVNEPVDVYRKVSEDDLHVPLDQIIYVGDGSSDMPVFELLNDHHGIAIGVYKSSTAARWGGRDDMRAGRRVQNLAPVDYRQDGELMQSLTFAVESICKRVALERLGKGE